MNSVYKIYTKCHRKVSYVYTFSESGLGGYARIVHGGFLWLKDYEWVSFLYFLFPFFSFFFTFNYVYFFLYQLALILLQKTK